MPKALVTGGAGFIGSHVVDALLAAGHEVHVIDDLSSGRKENLSPNAKFTQIDIRSSELASLIASVQPDIVVHLAAQISVRRSMEDPAYDSDVNVRGLLNLLHNFEAGRLPHFVMISTGGAIYGEQDVFPAPERHPIRPASVYGVSKYVGEIYLDLWSRVYGLKFVALRLANVYGPRQNPHGEAGVVAIFSRKLFMGESPAINGNGEQTRDFLFVKDVADAVVRVTTQKVEGVYNIGTGIETSVNSLYNLIAAASGTSVSPLHSGAKAGEQMRSCIDASFATREFGWKAVTSLEVGINETVHWFQKNS